MTDKSTHSSFDEYQDPLDNYEPVKYDDALHRALAEEKVSAIESQPFSCITPETTIQEAVEKLNQMKKGCLMVVRDQKLVGVLSDRDLLMKVSLEFDEIKNEPVTKVMTDSPIYVKIGDSSAKALSVMAVAGYRHVPVVDEEMNVCGIVSPQRVTAFLTEHFDGQ